MSEIEVLKSEINDLIENVNRDIENMQNKDPSQRLRLVNRCHNKLGEIRTRIEAYELEVLSLDKFSQTVHKEAVRGLQSRYKELKSQFERKKADRGMTTDESHTEDGSAINKNLDDLTGKNISIVTLI